MTKFRRKRLIDIMGVKHKIKHLDTGDKGGFYSPSDKEIEIHKDTRDPEKYLETVLHESLHGVLYVTGIHQDISLAQEHVIIDSVITFLMTNFNIEFKK